MFLPVLVLLAGSAGTPGQFEAHVQAGMRALDRNDPAQAQAEFEEAARIQPGNGGAWLLVAQACAKQKKKAAAVTAAQKAEKFGAGDPAILQGLAHFYLEIQPDLPEAARLIVRYAEQKPQDKTAWRTAAALYLEMGQPDQAIAVARRGLAIENGDAALHIAIGRAYTVQKQWSNAAAELREAVRLDPYDEDARFRLAQVYMLQQDFSSAVSALLDAKKVFAASPQIELALGVSYYGMRDFSHSIDQFLRTMKLAPDLPQPYVFLGRILEHAGDRLPEVIQDCRQFETRNPRSYLGYLLDAKAQMATLPPGDSPEAKTAFQLLEKALSLKEDVAEAHYLLGTLLERRGDFKEAAAQLERSVVLNAKDPAPHFRLARVYMRLGRSEDADRQRALHEQLSEAEKTAGGEPPAGP